MTIDFSVESDLTYVPPWHHEPPAWPSIRRSQRIRIRVLLSPIPFHRYNSHPTGNGNGNNWTASFLVGLSAAVACFLDYFVLILFFFLFLFDCLLCLQHFSLLMSRRFRGPPFPGYLFLSGTIHSFTDNVTKCRTDSNLYVFFPLLFSHPLAGAISGVFFSLGGFGKDK